MISRRIILGLFHLTCVIRTGISCGGNAALKVVEMCKGVSTLDRHFYLHGSPAGDSGRCDCNLTFTGSPTSVYFTPVSVTNNVTTCGGTMTLPDGTMKDCGRASRSNQFMFPSTRVVSFDYNSADVMLCVEVEISSAEANLSIQCPSSTTTLSSSPTTTAPQTTFTSTISVTTKSPATTLHTSTSTPSSSAPLPTSTSTTASTSTTKSPTVSSSENTSTSAATNTQSTTDDSKFESTTEEQTSFPVAAVAGGAGAGLLLLLVVVLVVTLCYRRGRHVDKQEESKDPTEVTVENSLYESSADVNNTQAINPLTTVEHQVNNPTGQLPPGLRSGIADQHNGNPNIADQHSRTTGSAASQETPAEQRDGTSDVYAVVNKPKKSLEATIVTKLSDHADPESTSKDKSPPPPSAIYAKVNKSS